MNFEILLVLFLLPSVLICMLREWLAPELAAMSAFCLLLVTGVLNPAQAMGVFGHPAPLSIAALFVLTRALEKTGGLDALSSLLRRHLPGSLSGLLLGMTSLVAMGSAFINNTPIVALFMPLLLGLARARNLSPSKLLIPLSYASILGGTCTLVGTSTNLIVSGMMTQYGLPALGMFELGRIGLPLAVLGILYLGLLCPRLLPARSNISSSLSEEERKTFFCQLLVTPESPWLGLRLIETEIARRNSGFELIEIRRKGTNLSLPLNEIVVEAFDRILVSASSTHLLAEEGEIRLNPALTDAWGVKALSTLQGGIMEGVVTQHSALLGKTIVESRFRQRHGLRVLALHRRGHNLRRNFTHIRLQFGDTLLLLGPEWRLEDARQAGDLMLLDEHGSAAEDASPPRAAMLAWGAMGAVVLAAGLNVLPIAAAALSGAVFLLLTRVLTAEEAVGAVDWSILFLIFGMLGIGLAMESSGAAKWIAELAADAVRNWVPEPWLPRAALALMLILTGLMTELLSNNATAAVMAPVAFNLAQSLDLNSRPFFIAVMLAASLSFSTPIGYQTNTMVFNAGGYRFRDFLRAGLPMNLGSWTLASLGIPLLWPLVG